MSVRVGWSAKEALADFDKQLRRARGVCVGTRRSYARFASKFLEGMFPDGQVEIRESPAKAAGS
jgi:hypothetical protein